MPFDDLMSAALEQARRARDAGEVPIGAVVTLSGEIVGRGFNQPITSRDPTAHAEMVAIRRAAEALGQSRLDGCTLWVTLEPCAMCAGAVVLARMPMLCYGCTDPKAGACETLYRIVSDERLNHRAQVVSGILAERCAAILSEFFAAKRRLGKK